MRAWRAAKAATSSERRSHLMSGCRRETPDALQGTSARMRSYVRPSHHDSTAVQSATGFFYLAVITALTAEFAAKVRFLP